MSFDCEIIDLSLIKNNYEEYNKKYFDLNKLKINYWKQLYKKYNYSSATPAFWNLRYYQLNFNNQLKQLSIPYVYMCYYKEQIVDRYSENHIHRLNDNSKNEQLYIYFFNQMIYQIFKIIDNSFICLNIGLNLGIDQSERIQEKEVADRLKKGKFGTKKHIINFSAYVKSYRGSKLENIKKDYRNKYTHDFIYDIPKAVLNNKKIDYEFFDFNKSFNDILKLLKILEKHLKQVEIIIKIYINNRGL